MTSARRDRRRLQASGRIWSARRRSRVARRNGLRRGLHETALGTLPLASVKQRAGAVRGGGSELIPAPSPHASRCHRALAAVGGPTVGFRRWPSGGGACARPSSARVGERQSWAEPCHGRARASGPVPAAGLPVPASRSAGREAPGDQTSQVLSAGRARLSCSRPGSSQAVKSGVEDLADGAGRPLQVAVRGSPARGTACARPAPSPTLSASSAGAAATRWAAPCAAAAAAALATTSAAARPTASAPPAHCLMGRRQGAVPGCSATGTVPTSAG